MPCLKVIIIHHILTVSERYMTKVRLIDQIYQDSNKERVSWKRCAESTLWEFLSKTILKLKEGWKLIWISQYNLIGAILRLSFLPIDQVFQ